MTEHEVVDRAARRLAAELVAQAPQGWTGALLGGTASDGAMSLSGWYTVANASRPSRSLPDCFGELEELARAVRAVRSWRAVSLELRCRPSGEYRLVAFSTAVTWESGLSEHFQVVLDEDYRLPQPGPTQQAGRAAEAGDPDLAVARLHAYLARRATILGHQEPPLPAPASAAALDQAERDFGRRLPADLRALYLTADGQRDDQDHLLDGHHWLSLASSVSLKDQFSEPLWLEWGLEWNRVVYDADPPGTVRRCGGHPAWLPFATRGDGNYLAVDLAPAGDGRPGQVIEMGRDHDDGPRHVAESVTALLGHYLDLLDQGAYRHDGDFLQLRDPAERGPREVIVKDLSDPLPPTLQVLHLNGAPSPVDLTPLTAATRLRRLTLSRCSTADLTPLRALPVEALRITLASGGDLTPLADHPHLASLDLATTAPVDLGPLRTVPNLRGLDLSRAAVRDLSVLADLPELRFLVLDRQQWALLLDRGKLPAALAAAHLADADASLDEALTWAAALGLDTEGAIRRTGIS
ncbi:SMI1/KNR4 family protein [Kitasatospora sp. LaBMicrA B282]|uniref:SMI1/KNR4 family protein n=1 Tax=Kitasatospora sp. LaBMicrA B282 TaxID=3420949 RepID=UPI003D12E8C4